MKREQIWKSKLVQAEEKKNKNRRKMKREMSSTHQSNFFMHYVKFLR